jgi:hypothetical protein
MESKQQQRRMKTAALATTKFENAPHGRPSQQLTLNSSTNPCLHSCRGLGILASWLP